MDPKQDAQASIASARKGSARIIKAGLGHSVVFTLERELDFFPNLGVLKERRVSTTVDI